MKKLVLAAFIAGPIITASPAFAQQATGSIGVSGTVEAQCFIAETATSVIALGELARNDGTLDAQFSGNTGGLERTFTVRCNSTTPQMSVHAKPLVNASATNLPDGFTNTVHYIAFLVAENAEGGRNGASDRSITPAPDSRSSESITAPLANKPDNVRLTIALGRTERPSAILAAGDYTGVVLISINPNV